MENPRHETRVHVGPLPCPVRPALAVSLLSLLVAMLSLLTAMFAISAPPFPTSESRAIERATRAQYDEASLLDHMVNMQRYVEKAALAAEAENWPLVAFYSDKISERATRVIDGGYVVDGTDVSAVAAAVADPRADALVAAARTGDADTYRAAYTSMVGGCNACHAQSGYPVIQIQEPDAARYPSQVFTPPRLGRPAGAP